MDVTRAPADPGGAGAGGAFQLAQVRVPLDEAADAFARRDASGRIPIVVIPAQQQRVRNELVLYGLAVLVGGVLAVTLVLDPLWLAPVIVASVTLIALGVFRSFFVRIPEGAWGLLERGGRYTRTIGSGTHRVPPWVLVSHLITRREIPFDVPLVDAPTSDDVRVAVDSVLTIAIDDPYRFVFNISTSDFDHVLQATCQEALRTMVRRITIDEVLGLSQQEAADLSAVVSEAIATYGVRVAAAHIIFAEPPADFVRSHEARQLAILQRAEQAETQALAERRRADVDALARQKLLARIERDRDELAMDLEEVTTRARIVEREADAEELRLARLEERLRRYPLAASYDAESLRLDVARALAGNSRAILHVGSADDISQVLLMEDRLAEQPVPPPSAAGNGAAARGEPGGG